MNPTMTAREIRAPRGTTISCRSWLTEAAMRMLMNNLDPDVAERPDDLVVYGGTGRAARSWADFDRIVAVLKRLGDEETLLIQSGRPVGVVTTHRDAPRVLLANSNLVGRWATWEHFRELEKKGLMMYGQMTAGSWIYIGSQGIVQGTFETLAEAGRRHFDSDLAGRLTVTAGLGGMGGAQPLAVTMNGGVCLAAEVDASRLRKRLETRYLDWEAPDLDAALAMAREAMAGRTALSIGVVMNAADLLEELVRRRITPDLLTDQTSAHDPLNGYVPRGLPLAEAEALRAANPDEYVRRARATMADHVRAMLELQRRGAHAFDYGNNLRGFATEAGSPDAFRIPGFVPEYIRSLFCVGKGPFRWAALSGEPRDIAVTDEAVLRLFPGDAPLARWIRMAQERIAFQGLPARICWLGYGERARLGLEINRLVREGRISAPIVIGRDHLDCGSVASPNRETEAMQDGSDAVSDWALLNALLNTASGATWVSFHHGGGVGMGYSQHAGQVIVADGTPEADARLQRVLTNDPGTGVMRHAHAGYDEALACARERGVKLPGLT